jgi:hypothetical protein
MAKPITVEKKKFDALLKKMLETPPLPREALRKKKAKAARA